MPKTTTTSFTYYAFRFDYTTEEEKEKVKAYIIREIPKYAMFDEVSTEVGKNHIQGKLGKCISDVQLRKHLKSQFPQMIKTNYSLSIIVDAEKYDSYICKDGKVLCNNVFTDEYIQEQVKIRDDNKSQFQVKVKKIKTIPFTQQVFEEFVKKFTAEVETIQLFSYKHNPTDYEVHRVKIAHEALLGYILKRLGCVTKVFDDNILQRMYNGIKNSILLLDENSGAAQVIYYSSRINL